MTISYKSDYHRLTLSGEHIVLVTREHAQHLHDNFLRLHTIQEIHPTWS
jgi:hypothetical protein